MKGLPPCGVLLCCRPVDQITTPAKTEKPNKEDDDAHSTTSYDL